MDLDWLKRMLARPGYSQAGLARALDRHPSAVNRMLEGKREIKASDLPVIEKYVGEPPPMTEFHTQVSKKAYLEPMDETLPRLILYRTIPMHRDGRDGFMLYAEKAGETIRTPGLAFSQNAFSVKVLDNKLEPVYRQKDTLVIDPDYHVILDEDCLFAPDGWEGGGFSVIARLRSYEQGVWKCRCLRTGKDFDLPRSEFQHAWPVMDRVRPR